MRIGQSRNSAVTVMNNRNTNICRGYENRYSKRNLEHQTGQMPFRRRLSDTEATEGYLPENIQRAMMVEAPERGAIYLVDFGEDKSCCLTAGIRPAVCISGDLYNEGSPILRVVPMTKRFKYIDAKYHVFVNRDKCDGLRESGMAMGEQTRPIDRTRIVKKIGAISDEALFDEIVRASESIITDYK